MRGLIWDQTGRLWPAAMALVICTGGLAQPDRRGHSGASQAAKGAAAGVWAPIGPAPIVTNSATFGDLGNIDNTSADDPASGAINALAAHPSDPDVIYIGSVNGGIWKTGNGTSASPTWVPQTDALGSLGVGDIQFDPLDPSNQTLVAGLGRFSSFARIGAPRLGVIRTTDGGSTWTVLGNSMAGRNVSSVVARGSTLVAGVDAADTGFDCANLGIFRSTDTGSSWSQITTGIGRGRVDAMAADPNSSDRLYASVVSADVCDATGQNGIYRSNDAGVSWVKVSDPAMDSLMESSGGSHVEISVGASSQVFVAIVAASTGQLAGVFRSSNGNPGSWVDLGLPGSNEPSFIGIHPGAQGGIHTSLVADPFNANLVYIGGDRQPLSIDDTFSFPNSINAESFSGRLFRGDATGPAWTPLTHVGTQNNSAPHADSRIMVFDANGDLLQGDDGGIFRRTAPASLAGDWEPVNGSLQVTEQHSLAYDTASGVAVSGNQDNGSSFQQLPGGLSWESIRGGDGGDVAIDTLANPGSSVRYASSQNLGGIARFNFDASNVFQGGVLLPLSLVGGGTPLQVQFVTPIAVNQAVADRLIIGGGSVYESLDQGDTIREVGPGITAAGLGRNSIAYGAQDNPDLLYVVTNDQRLYQRAAAGGQFVVVYTAAPGQGLEGVALDPADSSRAFLIENSRVMFTETTGARWNDVTGNLQALEPGRLRSVVYIDSPAQSAIAVGTDRGVFTAWGPGFSGWIQAGTGLPSAPVFDLQYDASQDRLIAGTLGRGAHVLDGGWTGNLPPVAQDDVLDVALGQSVTVLAGGQVSLLVNDSDPEDNGLVLQVNPVAPPRFGDLTLDPDGSFVYTHNGAGFSSDQFEYQVCDDGSPSQCTNATVFVSVDVSEALCSNPNVAIPDANATGVADVLDVGSFGVLTDLDLSLDITHSFTGDLTVTLEHEASGTSVVVLERPDLASNPSGFGCSGSNIQVQLDDGATAAVNQECGTTTPTLFGTFSPGEPLSAFNGQDFSGNWRLTVRDLISPDAGTLVRWCLKAEASGFGNSIFADGFEGPP
ncbi:MAG: Ig-like domain-containing protein [Xanthomonadales bacterium]|nr:Ig-like domain-containing protein [Xanthomonadales bacterium]